SSQRSWTASALRKALAVPIPFDPRLNRLWLFGFPGDDLAAVCEGAPCLLGARFVLAAGDHDLGFIQPPRRGLGRAAVVAHPNARLRVIARSIDRCNVSPSLMAPREIAQPIEEFLQCHPGSYDCISRTGV